MTIEKKIIYVVCILFFVYGLFSIFYGEKIPVGNGFGFDGVVYGNAAKNFYHTIVDKRISSFYLQRIFPSGVIYSFFKILSIDRNNDNIIRAFGIYNFILILLSICLWFKIGKELQLSDRLVLMGLVSFLFSYGIIKLNFYYPVLTDTTALFLGFLTVWGYISKKNFLILLCVLVGAFTWPTVMYTVPFLQVFRTEQTTSASHNFKLRYLFITSLILILSGVALYKHYFSSLERLFGIEVYEWLLPLGIMGFLAYVFFAFNYVTNFDIKDFICNIHKRLNYRWLFVYTGILLSVTLLSKLYPRPIDTVTFNLYIGWISLSAIAKPLSPLISHVVYYGPIVLLAVFFWKKISLNVQKYGIGLICFFAFYLFLSIDSESRHLMFFFPFFITFTLLSLKEYAVSNLFLAIYSSIALGFSKSWFMINTDEFVQNIGKLSGYDWNAIYSPPLQRYCMSSGLYMSFTSYTVQGIFVLLSGVILFVIYSKNNKLCRNSL